MAVTLVLSQVVGQAFVVDKNGETSPAQPNMQLNTGDVISVPKGKNAWLVTEDQEQIDVLDDALLVGEDGVESLNLPSDVIDIIAAIEDGQDPGQVEDAETAAGEEVSDSSWGAQVVIESNQFDSSEEGGIPRFISTMLAEAGLSPQQIDAISNSRYSLLANQETDETDTSGSTGSGADSSNPDSTVDQPATVSGDTQAELEDNDGDGPITVTGSIEISDPDSNNQTTIPNTTVESEYGTLVLVDGNWVYTLDPDKAKPLAEGEEATDVITLTATDGSTHQVTITVTGKDDAAEVSGDVTANVTDGESVTSASGSITVTDPDNGETATIENTRVEGEYGTFELVDGDWTYVLDPEKAESLADGEEAIDSITLTASDGSQHTIDITITGTDDAAVVTGDTTAVVQDSTEGAATATGSITVTDPDSGETATIDNTSIEGQYGTFELVDGNWTYTVDREKTQSLAEGEEAVDSITLTASDGSQHAIDITVTGTNDAAVVTGDTTAAVQDSTEGAATATGSITVTDPDSGETATIDNTSIEGQYGTFELVDGNWTYTVDREKTEPLAEGEEAVDSITLTASDGSQHTIEITVTGTNDAAVVTGDTTATVQDSTEGAATATGSITVTDPDSGETATIDNTSIEGQYGTFELVDGNWTYTVDREKTQSLAEGEESTDTITLTASDGSQHQITIDITGTDDVAQITGDTTSTVQDNAQGNAVATGSISISDPDTNDNTTIANTSVQGNYGTLVLVDGNWTYTVDKEAAAPLAEGEQAVDMITLVDSNGDEHQIVMNITGTNDPAEIAGEVSSTIVGTEGGLTATGQLSSEDIDGQNNAFVAETVSTLRGELTIDAAGNWTYVSTDPTGVIKSLGEGDTLTEVVTVRAADGTEQQIEITFEGVNDEAVFSAISTGTITEGQDGLSAAGSINVVDADAGQSFMQAGDIDGQYGVLTIDAAGNWSYATNDSSLPTINSLTDGEHITDTITVYSLDGSETQITITINGSNDDAVIDGDVTATVVDNGGTLSTSGELSSQDVDGNDNVFIAETIATPRGEFTINADGAWTYTSTDPTGAIERLGDGDTLTEVVTVRAEDGTEQQIVITLEGVNDAPVFSGISTRDVYETNDVISVSGSINTVDPDYGESFMLAGTYVSDFGSVSIDRAGNWTYTSDPDQSSALDALAEGETLVESITVRSVDGTETELLVTIVGTNDPAEIAGDITGTVIESDGTMSTTGSLTSTDVDGTDGAFTAQTIEGRWGELTIAEDGSWTYSTTDEKGAIDRLSEGDHLTDTITVRAEDGTMQSITITIDGTNDVATFGGMQSATINETDGQLSTSGRATVSDADYGEYFFNAGTYTGTYGEVTIDKAGNWTYTTDPSHNDMLNGLDAGDPLADTVTVYSLDGTPMDIVINIVGTDDLPVVSGEVTGDLTDTTTGETLTVSGEISISDVDGDDTPSFEDTRIEGEYGALELVDGAWTYTLYKNAASEIPEGDTDTDTITLTATDGTTQSIVITVTGTDDAPELRGHTTGDLDDGGDLMTSGTIEIVDPDSDDNPTLPDATVDGTFGSLDLVDGEWTYTLNPDSVASLNEGDITTDTITIEASDGSTHDIVITITGTDQEPVLQGSTTGTVAEGGLLTASGTVDLVDPDSNDNPTLPNSTISGQYGSLEMVDGAWTYTLDPELAQYLDEGETATDTISITASDGTVHDIEITITGSESAAEISGDLVGNVTDDDASLVASGSLSIEDPDASDNPTLPDTTQSGQYGTFDMVDGDWTYTLDPELAESLDGGVTVSDTITITDSEGGEHTLIINVTGTDDAAVLTGETTGTLTEGSGIVAPSASGTVELVDPDTGDTPTIENTKVDGEFGSLTLTDGEWTYTLNPGAGQSLGEGESTTDTLTLTDSEGNTHDIVITIEGTDDAPVVSGNVTGSVSTDLGNEITVNHVFVLGDDIDVDGATFGADSQPASMHFDSSGFSASITDSDGQLNNSANQTIELDGQSYPVSVSATVEYSDAYDNVFTMGILEVDNGDGSTTTLLIQIDGPDILPGTELTVVDGSYNEVSAINYLDVTDAVTATGTLSISDADANDSPEFANTTIEGEYGSLSLVDGEWTYTLDPSKAQGIPGGETVNESFTLTASDNTQAQITISVEGTDDAAVVTGDLSASVAEGGDASVSGSINISDPDAAVQPTLENGTVEGEYGSLTLTDGEWTYTVNPDNAQSLGDGDSATDTITVTASDGSEHQITITVTGSDDASVVTGVTTGGIDLGADTPETSVSGTLSITDVDDGDTPSFDNVSIDGDYGTFTLTDGNWTYTVDPSKADALNDNQTEQEVFTLTASDGTVQQITVDVTGADDAAVITGDSTASITEDVGAQTATGTITITDADTGDTPTIPNGTLAGEYGSLTLVDGAWTYTADSASIQSLADGDTATDTITVTASDGTTQDIVITITGTDDAAVVTGDTTGNTTDQGTSVSGSISISDVDSGENPTISNTTIEGEYGSLTLTDGEWTYTVNPENAQTLPDGESANDTFTLTASDGSTHQITVTVEGTDDAAVVTGDLSASVAEGGDASVSGSINISDPDAAVQPTLENGTVEGEYGSLTLTDGEWTYTVNPDNAQSLGDGDSATDTITVTASDGSEHQITITVTGSDDASVVTGVTTGGIDLGADTPETSVSGTLSITDVDDGDTPSFDNVSIDGDYGTFTLTDGNWTYTVDPSKADALNDNQTEQEVFTLTASDGTVQQITVDVTGADDAAVITGDSTASITEDAGAQIASGTITITDADTGDTPTIPNGTLAGEYGSLTLVDGAWTYTADSASIQSLADGDTATDTITVTASDGTTQDIVITITGTDDAAVVTGDTTGNTTDQGTSVSGSISISDADNGENPTISNTTIEGEYGSLTLTDGEWTYTVDPDSAQTLPDGESANDTFTLTASDGSTYQITVTVEGTDDAAVVTGDLSASVAEGGDASVSGSINISDPDAAVQPTLENGTVEGEYGSLTLTDGEWTYTVNPDNAQSLGDGDSATDTITVTASDGSEHQITITVTGSDDASVVTGVTTGGIDLGADTPETSVSGTLSITDVDDGDTPSFDNVSIDGDYGTFTLTDGNWTYTVDPSKADALNDNQTEQEVFTLTASDGTVQQITVDVTGADDAAVITGDSTASITEDVGAQTASGTITITDADTGDTPTIPNGTLAGQYGSLTLVDGAWTYTADSASIQSLADGDTATDTITVTASDGTTQDIVITITGTDDAAVIEGNTSGAITEDTGAQTASGTITITDADTGETPTIPNGTLAGEYGSLTLVDGAWTYTLDQDAAQSLNQDQEVNDTITVTASDGSTQDIVITVTGTEDAAEISGDTTGEIVASQPVAPEFYTVSGVFIMDEGYSFTSGNMQYLGEHPPTLSFQQSATTAKFFDDEATMDGDDIVNETPDDANQYIELNGQQYVANFDYTMEYTDSSGNVYTFAIIDIDLDGDGGHGSDSQEQGNIIVQLSGPEIQPGTELEFVPDSIVRDGNMSYDDLPTVAPVTTSGTIEINDADSADNPTLPNTTVEGEYGSLTLVDGEWTYTLDQDKAQSIAADETETDVITITASDGSTHDITITLTGTDDAAQITGDTSASITEDVGAQTATGTITITDADTGDTPTIPDGTLSGEYGSLELVGGEWTYTADSASIQSLADGDTATDTITVTASDGTTQDIVITITGTDDAAVIEGNTSGAITEDTGAQTASGTITITDADTGETPTIPNGTLAGEYGSLTLVDGAWTYTADSASIQSLADGDTATDTITVTASDGSTQDIVITITGTDDAAVVEGDTSGTVTEGDIGDVSTATGELNIVDPDGEPVNFPDANVSGEYGSLTLVDGAWTYTLDQDATQSLNQDQEVTDTITVTASDGTTQDITITVTGTDDAAEVSGTFTASVDTDGFSLNASESGNIQAGDATTGDSNGAWTTTTTTIDGVPYVISTSFGYDGTTIISRVEDDGSLTETDRISYDSFTGTVTSTSGGDITDVIENAGVSVGAMGNGLTQSNVSNIDGQDTLFLTSQNSGSLSAWEISSDGTLSLNGGLTFGNSQTGIVRENVTFEADDGTEYVFVARPQGDSIDTLTYNPETGEFAETGNSIAAGDLVSGVDIITVDGQSFLASSSDDGINIYSVDSATGNLTLVDSQPLDLSDGNSVNFYQTGDGTTYAIASSDGSDNASIFEVGANGSMTLTDTVSGGGAYMSSAGYVDGEPVFVMPNATEGVDLYTINDSGDLVLQTTVTGIENDKTPPVIVQTSDGSYYLVDGDGQSTTVKLDFGNDSDITVSGTLSISDADSDDSPSFENTTVEGEYGTLTLTEGVWTYTVDEAKSQSIGEDQVETDTITLTATDGTTQDIVISVTGSNDASEITGDTTGSITEDVGAQSVSGTLNIVDPDTNETPTFANETIAGEYGSLTMVDGEWTYTVDSDAVQSLTEGEAATDTITVTASDGTSQDIEISLTGTDDAAVVTGDTSASVTANSSQNITIGNAFVMDQNVDYESGSFTTWSFPPELNFSDSGITVQIADNDGQLNSDDSKNETSEDKTQSITLDGEDYSVNVDYSLSYEDGAGNTYTFAVVDVDMNGDGSNAVSGTESGKVLIQLDGPEITPDTSLSLVPDSYQNISSLDYADIEEAATVSGSLDITDVDAAEAPAFENTTIEGEYGSLTLVDGEWTYTVDTEKAQSLGEDQTATDTITLTATDGTTQNIDITVSGVDEVAVVSGDTTGNISIVDQTTVETSVSRGSEGMWDTNGGDSMTLDFSHVTTSAAYDNSVGYYVLDAEGNVLRAEIIFDDAHSVTSATADINTEGGEKVGLFIIPDGDNKGFNAGEVTLSFGSNGVTAYQGYASGTTLVSESSKNGNGFDYESNSGSSSSWEDIVGGGDRDFNDVTFTVNASQEVSQNITTSGTISISDVDEGQTPTLPNTTVEGEYGSLTLVDGEWTYTLDPELAVAAGEESIDTIVITASDGSQHEIVIAIAGTDDAPEVSGVFTGTVNEGDLGDTVSISGSISITDVDSEDTPEFEDTTITGQYGSLDLVDGVWTYTVDNEKTQELDTGTSVKDTITLTASDGTTQNIEVTVQGTDDAPFVVGTNSAAIVAPEPVSNDFIEINNGFILNEGYSFDSGDMQYYGNEPTLNFNQAGQTIRIYDEDGTMDGDNYYNEYVQDTSQKVEIGGVMYTATYDYQLDYQDSAGNIYTFAVLDVDLDGDGSFKYDSNEQGKMIIQIDGPEITPGMSMDFLRDTPNQGRTMSYEDIAVDTAAAAASVTGQLSLTDVDAGDSPYFANNTVEGSYGSLELVDGSWTYTLNPDSTSHLQHNDVVTDVITLTASDGVTQTDVNITIGGSETALAVNSHTMTSESMSDVISLEDITFTGTGGDDKIAGTDAHDVLLAQAGDDLILGNGGNDVLDGGLGHDILVGGQGNDTMAGGAGADTFAFLRGDQGTASDPAIDHITDFDTQNDALNLSDLVQTEEAESMESYLSLMDGEDGNATLSISSQGDGNVDQKVVFDNMSVEDMADAYSVDIAGMTSEQVSSSVIDAMIAQSKVIID